jgi:hypothetical protein
LRALLSTYSLLAVELAQEFGLHPEEILALAQELRVLLLDLDDLHGVLAVREAELVAAQVFVPAEAPINSH